MKVTEAFQVETYGVSRKRRCCCIACSTFFILLLIIILILIFTVFKPKVPKTTLISTSIDGTAPHISIPSGKLELNITLDLQIQVENPNHVSFTHEEGKSLVFYRENQIVDVEVLPGKIPAMGSEVIQCRLTVEAGKFGGVLRVLIGDVLNGEMVLETKTRISGRVKVLGFIKRRVVATSECKFTIGISDLNVRNRECLNKAQL